MMRKAGPGIAVTATARKISIVYYNTLKYGRKYVDLGNKVIHVKVRVYNGDAISCSRV